ncbi:MAG: carbohydrate kinase family protein [Paludibacteraceae bacterium]
MAEKEFDIIALGELNVDLILNQLDGLPEVGKEKFARQMTLTLGSSTAIFAANAASLGAKVAFCGMTGDDAFGELVEQGLQAKHVDTRYLIRSRCHATGATICLNYGEDRANVTYQGAMDVLRWSDINHDLLQHTKHVHISSIFMQSGLMQDLLTILRACAANGVTTSLDTQWDPSEQWALDYAEVLPLITVFMPNEKELCALTHTETLEDAVAAVQPYINTMVIKQGSKGSLMVCKDGTCHQVAALLNTHVVDAIGAGDSFDAGFVSQFVAGKPLAECQAYGNMTGAVNTTAAGGTAAFVSKEHVEQVGRQLGVACQHGVINGN